MTELTTMHLKCLLEQAKEIPQPTAYTYKGGAPSGLYEAYRGKESHVAEWKASMNLSPLAEAAPALAEEVIRLREHIEGLIAAMEKKAATGEFQSPAVIAGFLKEIVLGEANE